MKRLFIAGCLLLSNAANCNELVVFNGQEFSLLTGFCMSIYKGDMYYCWSIVKFDSVAELRIGQQLANSLALESCQQHTKNCKPFNSVCAR